MLKFDVSCPWIWCLCQSHDPDDWYDNVQAFTWFANAMVEHAEIFWSLFAVDLDVLLETQPPDTWDTFPVFQMLNNYLRNHGKIICSLRFNRLTSICYSIELNGEQVQKTCDWASLGTVVFWPLGINCHRIRVLQTETKWANGLTKQGYHRSGDQATRRLHTMCSIYGRWFATPPFGSTWESRMGSFDSPPMGSYWLPVDSYGLSLKWTVIF